MPIRFRCPHCSRLLGIARRKAGTETTCPRCGGTLTVPTRDEPAEPTPLESDNGTGPVATASRPKAAPKPQPRKQPRPGDDPPLFEGEDFDALLGIRRPEEVLDLDDEPPERPAGGVDATSLDDEGVKPLVLTPQRATLLVAVVVVLLGVAFAMGFLIASRT
jgi:phage FluMu protein Com